MSKLGTTLLMVAILAVGLLALFMATHAASVPFALQMAIIVLWSIGFAVFIVKRAKHPD